MRKAMKHLDVLLAVLLCLSLLPVGALASEKSEDGPDVIEALESVTEPEDASAETFAETTAAPVTEIEALEAGELERAKAWGLVPEDWSGDLEQAITYAEFCANVRTLVERLKPDGLSQWDQYAERASVSNQVMNRYDGAYGLLYAAIVLDCPETCYDYDTLRKVESHPGFFDFDPEPDVWPYMPPDFQIRSTPPGKPIGTDGYHDAGYGALWFAMLRMSPFNDMPLISWDEEYNLRWRDELTRREATVYLWRLVEGEANLLDENNFISVYDTGAYDSTIITSDLFEKESSLPEPSDSKLPSNWYGAGISHVKDGRSFYREYQEGQIAFLAEHGFNFARIYFGFNTLRFPGESYTEDVSILNETELRDLDQLIAWGMEYDVHIHLSMCHTPAGYQGFGFDEKEWENVRAYWEAIARRYADIPNRYLSFDIANEMMPSEENAAVETEHLRAVVDSIRSADPDRVLLISFQDNPRLDWVETVASLGLSLGIHPGRPYYIVSGAEDYEHASEPYVPYPYFPEYMETGEKMTISGEIGGKVLHLYFRGYGPFSVTFDNGEKIIAEYDGSGLAPVSSGGNNDRYYTVSIPDGVTSLVFEPIRDFLFFSEIGITGNGADEWLIPVDVYAANLRGGSDLNWDSRNGWSSERNYDMNALYTDQIEPITSIAEKYGVGVMFTECGNDAVGTANGSWDISVKANYDDGILELITNLGYPWSICEFETFAVHITDVLGWSNSIMAIDEFVCDSGEQSHFQYSTEAMSVYEKNMTQ